MYLSFPGVIGIIDSWFAMFKFLIVSATSASVVDSRVFGKLFLEHRDLLLPVVKILHLGFLAVNLLELYLWIKDLFHLKIFDSLGFEENMKDDHSVFLCFSIKNLISPVCWLNLFFIIGFLVYCHCLRNFLFSNICSELYLGPWLWLFGVGKSYFFLRLNRFGGVGWSLQLFSLVFPLYWYVLLWVAIPYLVFCI